MAEAARGSSFSFKALGGSTASHSAKASATTTASVRAKALQTPTVCCGSTAVCRNRHLRRRSDHGCCATGCQRSPGGGGSCRGGSGSELNRHQRRQQSLTPTRWQSKRVATAQHERALGGGSSGRPGAKAVPAHFAPRGCTGAPATSVSSGWASQYIWECVNRRHGQTDA